MTQTAPLIPGLNAATSTGVFIDALRVPAQRPLEFHLDGQLLVGAGYHVTEVKAVSIEAMDCGGKAAAWRETVIQLMDGTAEEARAGFLTNRKFLAIYDRVTRHIPMRPEAEVRFEYGNAAAAALQYHVSHLEVQSQRLVVHLRRPGVQCKAGAVAQGCAADSGCSPAVTAPTEPIRLQ